MGTLLETKLDNILLQLQLSYDSNKTNFDLFWASYYPIRSDTPLYWRAWNTDTGQKEDTNIANVFYYISWYLGHIYEDVGQLADDVKQIADSIVGSEDSELNQKTQDVKDKLTEYESSEKQITDSIADSLNGFDPSSTDYFGGMKAISWCGSYLQCIFDSLGSYGIPIMVALLLGLCMQFIGYFRYKK